MHVLSHGLHYGTGVFEGIRCYETERGPAIFRHQDHLDRLEKSAELYYLELPYSAEEIRQATHELLRRNGLRSCYIRPLAFRGYGETGPLRQDAPIDVIVAAWPWGAYLGDESKNSGIRAKVSSWRRISPARLDPARQGLGLRTSTRSSPRPSRPTPATTRRSCSTSAASSARARARTSSSSATARS